MGGGGDTGHCVPEGRSVAGRSCAQQKCVDPGISGSVLCLSQALDIFFPVVSLYHPMTLSEITGEQPESCSGFINQISGLYRL